LGIIFCFIFFTPRFLVVDESTLVLGFLPIGLAFHALFSIACAFLGWVAIKFAWPHHLEQFAEENFSEGSEKR